MPTCWLNAALLSASLLAGTAVVLDSVSPPIPSQCNQKLDGFCANASDPDLRTCYAMLRRRGEKLPMLAGLLGGALRGGVGPHPGQEFAAQH